MRHGAAPIRLYGFALSNYYNKVKFVLLEKGIEFEECFAPTGGDEAMRQKSPLGKVPFVETQHGAMCESQAIFEYLEAAWPEPPLLPRDPWQAGKVRELVTFLELHLELVARPLYPQAFMGQRVDPTLVRDVEAQLVKRIEALRRLLAPAPWLAGENFSVADCAAYVHLPVVAMATRMVLGRDVLVAGGIDWRAIVNQIGTRAAAKRVTADQRAQMAKRGELAQGH